MKSTPTIKTLLGLLQEEMAIILGITRTQWSMYEIGKRDLPLEAKKQLTALLTNQKHSKGLSKQSQKIVESEQKKKQEWLEQEFRKMEFKNLLLNKKIAAIENKRQECFAALEAVSFLASQPNSNANLLKSIQIRATNTLQKNSLPQLIELQMKKENLQMLKKQMEQKTQEFPNKL